MQEILPDASITSGVLRDVRRNLLHFWTGKRATRRSRSGGDGDVVAASTWRRRPSTAPTT
jgi:hypothetical protein